MIYVGPTYVCTPGLSDALGLTDGARIAQLSADTIAELHTFAAELGIPRARLRFRGTPLAHYIVDAAERMRARADGARDATATDLLRLAARRTTRAQR